MLPPVNHQGVLTLQVDEKILIDLINSESELYSQLLSLAPQAMSFIDSEDMEGLLTVLQEKQKIISKIELLSDSWDEVGARFGMPHGRVETDFWDKFMNVIPEKISSTLKTSLVQMRAIAENVLSADKVAQEVLEGYVNNLRARMAQVSNGRNAFKGYATVGQWGLH